MKSTESNTFFFNSFLHTRTAIPRPVRWGSRIRQLSLCREVRRHPTTNVLYDNKQSDGEAPVVELWVMLDTFS